MPHKVSRNIAALLTSRVLASILVALGYFSISRYLGTYMFGQQQFVLAYVMLFSVVVDFGIQQYVIKKVSENKEDGERYLGHFFATEFVLALFLWILLSAIAIDAHYDAVVRNAIIFAGFGMFLNALTIPHTSILSAHEDMQILAKVNFLDSIVNVVVMFSAIAFHFHVFYLVSVQFVNGIIHWFIYQKMIKPYVPQPRLLHYLSQLDFGLVKKMLIAALPFGMLLGFSIVYNKIDIILLRAMRGYADTGLYAAAYKFVDFLAFVPAVVSSSLFPFFSSQIKAGNRDEAKFALENYTRYMIAFGIPVALGGTLVARRLILLFGGNAYLGGAPALAILVFASGILFSYSAVNSIMINQLTKTAVKVTFANIFINVIGNLILIPRMGIKAAAIMTVVSELTQAVLYFYFVRSKIIKFSFVRSIWIPLLAGLIMCAALWHVRDMTLLLTIPLGAAVYGGALLLFRYFNRQDLDGLMRVLRRQA